MKPFAPYLFASDYDRTMTDYNGNIPQANFDAIQEFRQGGGVFTIATGRSWPMFQRFYKAMAVDTPVILYNGAAVYDPADDQVTVVKAMPQEGFELAMEIHAKYPELPMEFQGLTCHYCMGETPGRSAHLERNGVPVCRDFTMEDIKDTLNVAIFTKGWMPANHNGSWNSPGEKEDFDAIEAVIQERYIQFVDPVCSMPRMLEVMPQNTGKGSAARWLAKKLGKTCLACAGDAPNDLSMLEEADLAFLTGDCQEEMLGRGYIQVDTCANGAVASAIAWLKENEK